MPFYFRTNPRRPLWQPIALGAGPMLLWTLGQAFVLGAGPGTPRLGVLGRLGYVVVLTLLAGGVAGGLYWGYGTDRIRGSDPLRLGSAAAAAALYLLMLSLATGLATTLGPWARVARASFLVSTGLVAVVLGWVIARDPFQIAGRTERVYLTPAEFARLGADERARLRPDTAAPPDPADESRSG